MSPSSVSQVVVVPFPEGLHMRPADQLVRLASQYESAIQIGFDDTGGELLDCKSILSLLTLGATQGAKLKLVATGSDAVAAIDEMSAWFRQPNETSSDETQPSETQPSETQPNETQPTANNENTNLGDASDVSRGGNAL